ncbi:MAG: CoA-binding protein [Deltaproteobacteria bacterium]|nr:CoA-binding protein [Candidatus Zymogenaceae bacterium]
MTDVPRPGRDTPSDDLVRSLLEQSCTIAVVGLSPKETLPSHRVAAYMKGAGFRIIPVRPLVKEVLGEAAYGDLADIPLSVDVDIVNIFRRSQEVVPIVEAAVTRNGLRAVWIQEGVINREAARIAREAGVLVIMDRCILKEHARLIGG